MRKIRFRNDIIYDTLESSKSQVGESKMKTQTSFLKYIAALLLFGSNGIVASHIALSSYEIVLLRTLIGSLLLLVLFIVLQNGRFTFWQKKKDFLFLASSGIAMGVSWMFLYEAYQQIGVSLSSLLYYCGPVIVMILSPFLFDEKLTRAKVIGFFAVFIGVVLVNGGIVDGEQNQWGIFCAAMSAVMYAAMVICNKKAERIIGMENAALQLIISFVTVAVFVLCRNGVNLSVPTESWPWILFLGLVNTGIGCYFYFSSIGNLPVQTVAICGYLEPLSAVFFSVLLLHEVMLPLQIFGAVCIVGGAVYGSLKQ